MENQRIADARRRQQLAEGDARNEAQAAQKLIDDFIAAAADQRLEPEPLKAITSNGSRVKTDKLGWYIRNDKSVAVGTDGGYYSLTLAMAGGFLDRLRGVKLTRTLPSLTVNKGGRDGETGDLSEFLAKRLAKG